MGYSREVYQKAAARLGERRRQSVDRNLAQIEQVRAQVPGAAALLDQLAQTSAKISQAVLSHGTDLAAVIDKIRRENEETQARLRSLLASRGLREDLLEPQYFCPLCQDEGWVEDRQCSCIKRLAAECALEELASPEELQRSTFSAFQLDYYPDRPDASGRIPRAGMERILRRCMEYSRSFSPKSPSLLMLGATGLGKSHRSLAIAQNVVKSGFGAVYRSCQQLVRQLEQARFSPGQQPGEEAVFSALAGCDLMIIDDLGSEFANSFSGAALYNLINTRLVEGRPTIVSTNLTVAQIQQQYSDRLLSRLSTYEILYFLGEDIRMKISTEPQSPSL